MLRGPNNSKSSQRMKKLWREGIEHRSRATLVYLISNWGVKTQKTQICCLLNVPKIMRFLGGPNRPKICVRGTKINFKDWDPDASNHFCAPPAVRKSGNPRQGIISLSLQMRWQPLSIFQHQSGKGESKMGFKVQHNLCPTDQDLSTLIALELSSLQPLKLGLKMEVQCSWRNPFPV